MSAPLVSSPVTIFLIVMLIILLAPVALNRLKIPHIIGMIVAGIVVGPDGLNILARDSSFDIFGQVGLLYLMFLAGLEIDMFHLRMNLRRGLVFGALTFLIPMVVGIFASVYVLKLGWLTSVLLASMYASHTLISYPVAARFGITQSPSVLIAIVGTIVAVVGALLVLAGVVNTDTRGALAAPAVLGLVLRLALFVAAILYLYPRLTRWFFKGYSDRVTQYVYVMAMAMLAAWASGRIGLEPVLGAFLAGLVLNRYVPRQGPLMTSIEFVGNALFIPYFLIGVGMMINLRVVATGGTLSTAVVMLAVALAGKWVPAYLTQKLYGLAGCDRRMLFGLSTAHTAVALAVVTIGYNTLTADGSRMMDETILNGTILVILVTCALAPLVTSEAAAKIRLRQLQTDADGELATATATGHAGPVNTLVGVANPITAASLVELALLMRRRTEGVLADRLYGVHVRNDNSPSSRAVGRNSLRLAQQTAAAAGTDMELIERYDLNTVTGLLNAIAERDIAQVVIGMHRRSTVIDTALGGKIEQLLAGTDRMVVISRCYIPANTVTRIVVWVPQRAQYESGFSQWVLALGSLAQEVGCRLIFSAAADTIPFIRAVIERSRLGVRHEYVEAQDDDYLVLQATKVLDDDLLVIVAARANTVSHSSAIGELPSFIQRYFARNNLLLLYPSQALTSGTEGSLHTFSDPLHTDINAPTSARWLGVRAHLHALRRRLHR